MSVALVQDSAAVAFLLGCFVAASLTPCHGAGSDHLSDDTLQLRGVFETQLPGIEPKHSLRLTLHPHFGDLVRYDHLRTAIGVNYALTRRLEVRAETEAYISHGLGDVGFFDRRGFGEVRLSGKYRLGETSLLPGWDSAIGAAYQVPVDHPPRDVTDGLEHTTLWATFVRPLRWRPDVRVFWGVGADFITPTDFEGRHDRNALRDDNQFVSAGLIVDRGTMHYTMEVKASTTRLLGDVDEDVIEIRPGFVWELPRGTRFNRRGKWVLGMALSTEYGPDGLSCGLGVRLRIDLDLKRAVGRR